MAGKEDLKAILEQVGKLQPSIEQFNNRIDKLEQKNYPAPVKGMNASATINNMPDQRLIDNPTPISPSDRTTAADIQADLDRIRDSLLRTPAPNGFKVHDSQVGIKQEAKGALKILSKCARNGETALKMLVHIGETLVIHDLKYQRDLLILKEHVTFKLSHFINLPLLLCLA